MGPGQQQNAHPPPPVRGQQVHPGKVLGVRPDPALRRRGQKRTQFTTTKPPASRACC